MKGNAGMLPMASVLPTRAENIRFLNALCY